MTTPRKKLVEVALPLDAINKESAREKSIRPGYPQYSIHILTFDIDELLTDRELRRGQHR